MQDPPRTPGESAVPSAQFKSRRARFALPPLGPHARAVVPIIAGGLLLLFAFTSLYVAAFHAPRAKGLDVGVVGSGSDAAAIQTALDSRSRGAFDVHRYGKESQARAALLHTDIHGVLAPGGAEILVAGAFGVPPTEAVTNALRGVAPAAQLQDIRPLPASDRRGLASLFTVIGTLIPSLVFGVLLSVFGRALPARVRWAAVLGYATLAGLVVAFSVDVLVDALTGTFVGVALVTGLLALAMSSAAHGLGHLGGPAGIVTAILLLLLLGLSSSGGAVTFELEPGFFGAVSQLLPPGAALTSLRNAEYFDWAATLAPLIVLGSWAAGGLVVGLLGEVWGPHVRAARAAEGASTSRAIGR